ncbi:MAG: AIPR family protein [Cyclobacteriaceae bacterium]|nr:AIPR family protein [Cyclobacteriaceae bacterium]
MENKELLKFFTDIQEEVKASLISQEDGSNPEQLFTDYVLALLADAGETENYRICYDEKISKRGVEHKINAYALYENYETLDLFITIYSSGDNLVSIPKADVDKAVEKLSKFFRNAVYKEYVNEIEESSEVFDLAHTLASSSEITEFLTRVNVFVITNGEIKSDLKATDKVGGYPVFYRAIDINYLFNLSEKSGVAIEIDFIANNWKIPCIDNQIDNNDYQSYLAIFPGNVLVDIYEQYGSRLLEQNVRSFLQFTGKINKGIRKTILEEPHMFMAFNNGIAATADEVTIIDLPGNKGKAIGSVKDFQIVNGGQTTASIYHTWKKDKANVSGIFVPVKLTIVKDKENFSEIVGRIAEYANTQNRVSASDLSSNRENHVIIEKLSRSIWAPPKAGENFQTRWFFERSRGQFKNERQRYGLTPARRKQFDKQNPRGQMFTKETLAKYVNAYKEVYSGKKLLIGPHFVVRGSQKNYSQFLNYNFSSKPDNIWFEDAIAKTIIFNSAEKIYGVKPNSIGDMRYITVPYAISWLALNTNYKIDLGKIWRTQSISEPMKKVLYEVMIKIEAFIKSNAPGSLYGEWAKKEECWNAMKDIDFGIDLTQLKSDFEDLNSKRKKLSQEETQLAETEAIDGTLKSIHSNTWKKIEAWGRETGKLSLHLGNIAFSLSGKVRNNRTFSESERQNGLEILDIVTKKAPELFYDMDEFFEREDHSKESEQIEVTLEDIKTLVDWDKKNKRLQIYEFKLMHEILKGEKELTDRNKYFTQKNIEKAKKWGFKPF